MKNSVEQGANEWIGIDEAVVLSTRLGLTRTPKTIRKWASRSFSKPDDEKEIDVRQVDTPNNGYRWMLSRASVERKIKEEIEILKQNDPSHSEHTPATQEPLNDPGKNNEDPNPSEPVRTPP